MIITRFRASFIQTETIPEAWRIVAAPLRALTMELGYARLIDTLQRGQEGTLGLQLPWPRPSGQHFWERYLHHMTPGRATGRLCFERLVPLRYPGPVLRLRPELARNGQPVTAHLTLEGFFYPFGIGAIATVTVEGEFDLAETGEVAQAIRKSKAYRPTDLAAGAAEPPVTLDRMLGDALTKLAATGFSETAGGERGLPLSVVTVLTGRAAATELTDEVRALLGGLTHWTSTPQNAAEGRFARLKTRRATSRPGDILAAADRARVVWFPMSFDERVDPVHTLACYHRNLVFATLQTESLLALGASIERSYAQSAIVPNTLQRWGDLATDRLAELLAGRQTYRSNSVRAQILSSDRLTAVAALIARYCKPALTPDPGED